MLFAIWNSLQIPYSIAFSPENEGSILFTIFNLIIDSFFIADVFISFRSSYINDETGEEISSSKLIALQYIKGRFWVDLMSSLPTDIIEVIFNPTRNVKTVLILLKLLKMIRLARLSRVITYLNLQSNVKMTLRLGKLIFFLILYLHLIG